MDPAMWTDEAVVALTAGQLGVLVIAALVAWRQVREARRLREEEHRPFVVVDLEIDEFVFMQVVSNLGSTMARDVRISISPPLQTSLGDTDFGKIKMLSEGISTFAPGRAI